MGVDIVILREIGTALRLLRIAYYVNVRPKRAFCTVWPPFDSH